MCIFANFTQKKTRIISERVNRGANRRVLDSCAFRDAPAGTCDDEQVRTTFATVYEPRAFRTLPAEFPSILIATTRDDAGAASFRAERLSRELTAPRPRTHA